MPMIATRHGLNSAAMILLTIAGCGDASKTVDLLPRRAISGTVTLDGKPLTEGKIQFDPVGGGTNPTAVATADIKEGKFAIDRAMGPVPGKYKVSISSRPSNHIGSDDMPGGPPAKLAPEKIPAQYNLKTTLSKEVSEADSNQFDFPLVSK